jgi:hypothetical protein
MSGAQEILQRRLREPGPSYGSCVELCWHYRGYRLSRVTVPFRDNGELFLFKASHAANDVFFNISPKVEKRLSPLGASLWPVWRRRLGGKSGETASVLAFLG